jgi:hypothetical protein
MTKKRLPRGNFKILLVSQYRDLLRYLEKGLVEEGISSECILTAESARPYDPRDILRATGRLADAPIAFVGSLP